ncbi:MAG: YfbU family protein [Gammaproteobacteria bacterium]|jgi:hypothetical protein|nr:YfbU family protein [Gammaproteobacteria bacterium]
MKIELTDTERFALALQYEILDALKPGSGYADIAESLRNGHKWIYDMIFEPLYENLSEESTSHVLDIIELFDNLNVSVDHLEGKTKISKENVQFPGFDGNHETALLGFAKDLLKHHRYESVLANRDLNSHSQTTDMYERMLARWRDLGAPPAPMSEEHIRAILDARRYPR